MRSKLTEYQVKNGEWHRRTNHMIEVTSFSCAMHHARHARWRRGAECKTEIGGECSACHASSSASHCVARNQRMWEAALVKQ